VDAQVERVPYGEAMVVRVFGEVDRETAAPFRDAISQTLADGVTEIVVNLAQVEYIDSVGLGVIIAGATKAQKAGGRLVVCGLGTHLQKVFEISGVGQMVEVSGDEEEALAAAGRKN
jgi:anti-sigma F factor antagonist